MSSVGSLTNLKGSELNQLRESRAQQPNDNSQSTRHAIYTSSFYANGHDSLKYIKNHLFPQIINRDHSNDFVFGFVILISLKNDAKRMHYLTV